MKKDQFSSISDLIEHNIKSWELGSGKPSHEKKKIKPIIAISRQIGAKGLTVSKKLGDHLNFKIYNKEIIQMIADYMGKEVSDISELDEKARDSFFDWLNSIFTKGKITTYNYQKALKSILKKLEEEGNSIILGRGAYLHLSKETILSVRIVAPISMRVSNLVAKYKNTETEARNLIEKSDIERRKYIKDNFNCEINDPTNYDIIINNEMGVDKAVAIITKAYHVKFNL